MLFRWRTPPSPDELLRKALAENAGNRAWQGYKAASASEIAQMAAKTDRMTLYDIDLTGDLNCLFEIKMPVPCWPQDGHLRQQDRARFHLRYAEDWRYEAPAGWLPLGILEPGDVFHPACRPSLRGAICLGDLVPGVPPREIILLGYLAVTLQAIQLDERDPHGVLNVPACEFYRNHPEYVPLTRKGLYEPWEPQRLATKTAGEADDDAKRKPR
jgi:hypothetical protein